MAKRKGKVGSSFDEFLAGEGILETCEEQALKQILADQIKAAMEERQAYQVRHGGADADQQASPEPAGPRRCASERQDVGVFPRGPLDTVG